MKIGLLGYGNMGKEIEAIAIDRGHEVIHRFNRNNLPSQDKISECDVIIEFTLPDYVIENLQLCLQSGTPVVSGTTGWYEHLDTLRKQFKDGNGTLFTASNFSLGVNIVFYINKVLAKIMSNFSDYRVDMLEVHHTRKLDAPSGTAITLANGIIENITGFNGWQLANEPLMEHYLPIAAIREGDVPGTHKVKYTSNIDTIELTHIAHNRKGFALGAVLAAEWCLDKKGAFGMEDMLNFEGLK